MYYPIYSEGLYDALMQVGVPHLVLRQPALTTAGHLLYAAPTAETAANDSSVH
jgi:hypothetical protein